MYKHLAEFVSRLNDNITEHSRHLPISIPEYEYLLSILDDGDYSFLEIRDGNAIEIVKVRNECDRLVIDRGEELTLPMGFRCSTGIKGVLTMQSVKDMVCQMTECPNYS